MSHWFRRFLLVLLSASLVSVPALADRDRPNIVFLLADDMGYGDLGCYGCPDAKTPVIDTLARQGVRFTQFYANGPECTPSRTALMTGRYPQRAGGMECAIGTGNVGRYDDAIRLAEQHQLGLPVEQAVIPKAIVENGYRTAVFGKWHMGYESHFNPLEFGWHHFFGVLGGNCDYFTHRELSPIPVLYGDRDPVEKEGYLTHLLTDEAVAFLKSEERKNAPFLLYVPFTTPHFPFQTPTDTSTVYTEENFTKGTRSSYVTMLEDMDAQVGRILAQLEASGLAENTLVAFASDHGAMKPGRNLPLNGYKGGLFEGGIRAPLIVRWPDRIKPGQVCDQACAMFDFTASLLRIAGAAGEHPQLDGIDILQHVENGRPRFDRSLFWRAKRGNRTWWAVRDGDKKYIRRTQGGTTDEWVFDLAADAGEIENIIDSDQKASAKLKQLLDTWEKNTPALR